MRQRLVQQHENRLIRLAGQRGRVTERQAVARVGQAVDVVSNFLKVFAHRAAGDAPSPAVLAQLILAIGHQLGGGQKRRLRPAAAARNRVDAAVRRGKQREHAVVVAVLRPAQHDRVARQMRAHGLFLVAGGAQVALAVAPVLVGDLPLLFRRILPQLKAFELRFRIDVDPELENDRAVIGEFFFKLVDLAVGALPVVLAAVALDALDHDAAVPAAVEDGDVSGLGQARPEAPEVLTVLFVRRGAGNGQHLVAARF